jgi:hypothetical protein
MPKETPNGSIPWLNTSIGENATIDPIMNAIMPVEAMVHILKQGIKKVSLPFQTPNQVIKNILKNIVIVA